METLLPIGLDWIVILPAVRVFLEGGNPYLFGEGFHKVYEPIWTYILLSPIAIFPFWTGRAILFLVSLIAFIYTAVRMGANTWQLFLFLASSSVIGCLNNGNIDWLVTAGLWMPPQVGLFFVLIKPQVGAGIAIYWMCGCYVVGGWKQVLRTFAPVTVGYLLSFWIYGFWIREFLAMDINPENMSGFPWTVPIGIFLLTVSVWSRRKGLAIFSGPLFAPYVSQFSYATLLLALLNRPRLYVIAWILLWIPVLLRFLP